MATKKKSEATEEAKKAAQAAQNDAQSVEEPKDTQTPTEEKNATESATEALESTEPTELSDAPQEIKDEILKNAEKLGEEPAPEPDPIPLNIDEIDSLQLPGDYDGDEPAQKERWSIADDGCADWALKKIKLEKDELDRITVLADQEIARLKEQVEKAKRRYEQNTAFLTSMLAEFFETVPHKKTKTGTESYRLLNGQLVKKPATIKLQPDDEKLVEWLRTAGREDLIKVEAKAMWGELKKQIEMVGTVATMPDTGEIVEGINVMEVPPAFSVKF